MFGLLFKLLIGHALADFALQNNAMASWKSRSADIPAVAPSWYYWMTGHSLIHAGAVWIITGSMFCASVEAVSHWIIDFMKCESLTGPHVDQLCHLIVKLFICWFFINVAI